MEISGISSIFPFIFPNGEKGGADVTRQAEGDIVDIHSPQILADDEVEAVYNETLNMIASDNAAALSVHSGLSANRVFALLGM